MELVQIEFGQIDLVYDILLGNWIDIMVMNRVWGSYSIRI